LAPINEKNSGQGVEESIVRLAHGVQDIATFQKRVSKSIQTMTIQFGLSQTRKR